MSTSPPPKQQAAATASPANVSSTAAGNSAPSPQPATTSPPPAPVAHGAVSATEFISMTVTILGYSVEDFGAREEAVLVAALAGAPSLLSPSPPPLSLPPPPSLVRQRACAVVHVRVRHF